MSQMPLFQAIVQKTLRVPMEKVSIIRKSDSAGIARQLDITLMSAGFKLSGELMSAISRMTAVKALELSSNVVAAISVLIGDHRVHNVYFKNFPRGVPDTMEFWTGLLLKMLPQQDDPEYAHLLVQLGSGRLDLLTLPGYGKYQHSYSEMLKAHEAFVPSMSDRVTVVHKGESLATEAQKLFQELLLSPVPLSPDDRELLNTLEPIIPRAKLPKFAIKIPVRENKAVFNAIRLKRGFTVSVDTPTDVLRLATVLSGGDVTLETNTKLGPFPRKVRRQLMEALDNISTEKHPDVWPHHEKWKRLGERLRSGEYHKRYPNAWRLFAHVMQDRDIPLDMRSISGRVDLALSKSGSMAVLKAIGILRKAPGLLFRNIDRLLSLATAEETEILADEIVALGDKVSPRVLLSLREHLQNRHRPGTIRVFANRKGTAWTQKDERDPIASNLLASMLVVIDNQLRQRLDAPACVVVDERALRLAVPLSDKYKPKGFGIAARGSVVKLPSSIARFFLYWKEVEQRTDYDLSALVLDAEFNNVGQVSYTNLRWSGRPTGKHTVVHSGDITHSEDGASEFIQADLAALCKNNVKYILPQVNLYAGEDFDTVEEGFFGVMGPNELSKGKPFEPRLAHIKSELRGKQRVSLPLVLYQEESDEWGAGGWVAKWLHLAMKGHQWANRLEGHTFASGAFVRSVVERDYLTVDYLVSLMIRKDTAPVFYKPGDPLPEGPVTFIGLERPEGLHKGSQAYTVSNLSSLLSMFK